MANISKTFPPKFSQNILYPAVYNLDDYEIKGIKYRDVVLDDFPFQNRHTLKKDKIEEEKIDPKDYLPSEI